jgi:hypothetical protein
MGLILFFGTAIAALPGPVVFGPADLTVTGRAVVLNTPPSSASFTPANLTLTGRAVVVAAPPRDALYTALSAAGVPGVPYGPFAPRALAVLVSFDPADCTLTGHLLVSPAPLVFDPADLRIKGARFTDALGTTTLTAAGVPGVPYGPFQPRAIPTLVVFDPAALTLTGQPLAVVAPVAFDPANLTVTGQAFVVPQPVLVFDPADLTVTGGPMVSDLPVSFDPADCTLGGGLVTVFNDFGAAIFGERSLEPLTGVF